MQKTESKDDLEAKLKAVPDLDKKVTALLEVPGFKDLGEALNDVATRPLSKQVQAIGKAQRQEDKKQKKSITETLGAAVAFFGGNNETLEPPQPKPDDPLICKYCGAKLKPSWTWCNNCGAPVKPQTKTNPLNYFKPQHKIGFLDAGAGIGVFIIWVAATIWIAQSFAFSWGELIGLVIFWLFFIVVFRSVIRGLLD